jgi:hypothetical protein
MAEKVHVDLKDFDPTRVNLLARERSVGLAQCVQAHRLGLPLDTDLDVSSEYLTGSIVEEDEGLLLHPNHLLI